MVTPTLHHVTLKTRQLDVMIDWYSKVVGLSVVFKFAGGAWLTNDAANHRVAILQGQAFVDGPDRMQHVGFQHQAFEFANGEDMLHNYERLRDLGIIPRVSLDHGPTVSFYYADPDENAVELQYDNFGDWAQSSEWMRTSPDFARNPIGAPIDPDKLVAAWHDGADLDELHRRAYAGEFPPEGELPLLKMDTDA